MSHDPVATAELPSRVTPVTGRSDRVRPSRAEDDGPPPLVTIVLPCFNEREHVIAEVERICAAMDASA